MIGWSCGHLAVEHAQRVRLGAALAIGAHRRSDVLQPLAQRRDEHGPALRAADGVDQQLEAVEPDTAQDLDHHLDHFGVDRRRFGPDRLGADLVELPVAALLRALAAEHRADVVELLHAGLLVQPVLDLGADHRRRVLGPQRQRGPVIVEGVHLLADDVGLLADAAREQRGLLEDRRADLAVVVARKIASRDGLHVVPHARSGRQMSRVPFTARIKRALPDKSRGT